MKKFILFLFLLLFLLPLSVVYADNCPDGLVPCGLPDCPCTLCHFFEMIGNIVDFIQRILAPVLAVLMIVIGGTLMITAYISPNAGGENLTRARSVFKATAIGLVIVWGGWIILNAFLTIIGVSANWWIIQC